MIDSRHYGPIERAAGVRDSKAHWFTIDQRDWLRELTCSWGHYISRCNRKHRHVTQREVLSKDIESEFCAASLAL